MTSHLEAAQPSSDTGHSSDIKDSGHSSDIKDTGHSSDIKDSGHSSGVRVHTILYTRKVYFT